jgi:signal peptide peptidase SppA
MKNNALRTLMVSGFNDRPALIAATGASEVAGWLRNAQTGAAASDDVEDDISLDLCAAAFGVRDYSAEKPFVYQAGVAYIPVYGTLINRFNYYSSWYNATGYQYIRNMFDAALADTDVKGIVFDVNSHGGQVYGCFELAGYIREKRGEKPTMAVVDAMACSAAYALASSAGKLVVSPSGDVGSVGVLCMHFDLSKMYEEMGVKVTPIFAGKHKVDGNPYEPLPDDVRKDIQASIDKTYSEFVALVAANRGLNEQAVRDTEARTFDADAALELGLVDEVAMAIDAVSAFQSELSGSNNNWSYNMSNENKAGTGDKSTGADELNKAAASAATAERTRIDAIMSSEHASGREDLAKHFALKTGMSAEDAIAAMAAAPKAAPVVAANPSADFSAAMASENPNVGLGGEGGEDANAEDTVEKRVARITSNYQSATGMKPLSAA